MHDDNESVQTQGIYAKLRHSPDHHNISHHDSTRKETSVTLHHRRMPINAVIANRHSVREFDLTREINDSTLGQLLWMSVGVNRPDVQPSKFGAPANRSNPTARNWQEIHAFVFDKNGIWEYQPSSHTLTLAKPGDHRSLIAGTKEFSQDFASQAPVTIVFVADMTDLPDGEQARSMAMVDVGIACQTSTSHAHPRA